jgi:site-specific DNA-cytosine methylase
MNILSLFDGISCGQLALGRTRLQIDNYFASEISKDCMDVANRNFPNTIQLGDVQTIDVPRNIDVLIGGSPCQGFSVAGKGLNFVDPRSRLFFDFVRVLEICKPKYFLLENTPMKAEWRDIISSYLGVQPVTINSELVSAQSRKRLYWTNIPNITQPKDKNILLCDILDPIVDEKYYIDSERAIQICDLEAERGKIGYFGTNSQGNRIYSIWSKSVTLCGQAGGFGAKTGLYWIPCITPDRVKKRQNGPRFKPSNAKFYTLTAQDRHGVLVNGQIRKLTPVECERLQTIPENYTAGLSDNKRYKLIGNAWTVDIISHLLDGIVVDKHVAI